MERPNTFGAVDIACSAALALADAKQYDEAYLALNKASELVWEDEYFQNAMIHSARAYIAYQSRDKYTAMREAEKALELLVSYPTEINGESVAMSHVSQLVCNVQFMLFLAHISLNNQSPGEAVAYTMAVAGIKNTYSAWNVKDTDDERLRLYRQILHSRRWNFWFYQANIRARKLHFTMHLSN